MSVDASGARASASGIGIGIGIGQGTAGDSTALHRDSSTGSLLGADAQTPPTPLSEPLSGTGSDGTGSGSVPGSGAHSPRPLQTVPAVSRSIAASAVVAAEDGSASAQQRQTSTAAMQESAASLLAALSFPSELDAAE